MKKDATNSSQQLLAIIRKLFDLFTVPERKRARLLMGMMIIMALLDMVGIASVMPFVAALANPDLFQSNVFFAKIYHYLDFKNQQDFLFALGSMVFFLLLVSIAFKGLTTYAQIRFALMREYSIGRRLIEGYLHQPYVWFLDHHSSDLGKTILSEVSAVINGGMIPLMNLVAQSAVAIALLILLLFVDTRLALTVGSVLALSYFVIIKLTSNWLLHLGKERILANQARFNTVSEAFSASKEVKLAGLENFYIDRFSKSAEIYARGHATAQIISQTPRFALEGIAFGGMLLVVLYLIVQSGGFADAIPVIALYVFAGYRLMPALQQIYGAFAQLRYVEPALNSLHRDLSGLTIYRPKNYLENSIDFKHAVSLENVKFYYPNTEQPVLNGISLSIPACSKIGIVGSTGSGKTTMIDLLLGLLEPEKGFLRVDGVAINKLNRAQWQRKLGYVPQQIFLTDDTIAANIAFGVDSSEIDMVAVERAAKIANLHNFIANDLPLGYKTTVGERGVRLSGGQRQRIGISRALYHSPEVLILDEATSALDNVTEQAVIEAIKNLKNEITIILIAHRLSTVSECDCIYLLNKGEIEAYGTYDELNLTNATFKAMTSK